MAGVANADRTVVEASVVERLSDLRAADGYARLTKSRPTLSSIPVCDMFTD
jgi:hypothetical protein